MMKPLAFFALMGTILLSSLGYCQQNSYPDFQKIRTIMERQENDWNNGDVRGFMKGYWESEKLKFIGKSGITYGWQATLDRYLKNYPDQKTMGKLEFTLLEMEKVSSKSAFVIGKWHLTRELGNLQGHFSLLWKKIKGKWVIVVDHSS